MIGKRHRFARRCCFEFRAADIEKRGNQGGNMMKRHEPESDRVETHSARPLIRAARTGTHTRSAHCHFGEAITKKNLKKKLRVARSRIIGAVAQTHPSNDADSFWRCQEKKNISIALENKTPLVHVVIFGERNNFRPETAGRFRFSRSELVNGARD